MFFNKRSLAYRPWFVRCLILAVLLLFLSMQPATPLLAEPDATFVVTLTFDATDSAPGDGICAISAALGSGCTLRAAIQEANARPGPDTIQLPPGLYQLTINPNIGLLITDPAGLTIEGAGALLRPSTQLITILPGARATIDGLTLDRTRQGYQNLGSLTLTNGAINGTNAPSGFQPGILSRGPLTVTNFIISNYIPGNSPAIQINGNQTSPTLTTLRNVRVQNVPTIALATAGGNNLIEIIDSSFDQNVRGMLLGGIANQVTIRNSTISNNRAGGIEVGFGLVEFPNAVNILNSTISGNQNNTALRLFDGDGQRVQVLLNNVTIANNHGGNTVGGIFVPNASGPSPVAILNSIIAKNTTNNPPRASDLPNNLPADCNGRLLSRGHNLFGTLGGCTVTDETATNIVGDPLLLPLADNFGPTLTHAVPSGSLAENAGNPAQPGSGGNACEASDQRGITRLQGADCEIGAYEGPSDTADAPQLTSIAPTSVLAPAAALPLTLTGANFNASSRVLWRGLTFTPSAFTTTTLQTTIPASELTAGKSVSVTVFDTARGLLSNGRPFTVNNPLPTVITSRPTSVRLGTFQFIVPVDIIGTNFVPTSVVSTDNSSLKTDFVNAQELRVNVPASTTRIRLFVTNPAPGGGKSVNFGTLTTVNFNVGIGSLESDLKRPGDLSTLTLGWEHPVNWRLLENMALRLLDENDEVVLWLSFAEEFGDKGALVLHSAEGAIAGIGFPGDATLLASDVGLLDLANSQIDAEPGTTAKVIYGFRFDQQAQGRTFQVEFSAEDKEGNAHGFEPAGTITVPTAIFLPSISK